MRNTDTLGDGNSTLPICVPNLLPFLFKTFSTYIPSKHEICILRRRSATTLLTLYTHLQQHEPRRILCTIYTGVSGSFHVALTTAQFVSFSSTASSPHSAVSPSPAPASIKQKDYEMVLVSEGVYYFFPSAMLKRI